VISARDRRVIIDGRRTGRVSIRPGAGIGWQRDRPVYGEILGVSFLAPCVMRLRRKDGTGWRRSVAPLAPGSAYRLSGAARSDWEHSISPMTVLRYSITFRTLAGQSV